MTKKQYQTAVNVFKKVSKQFGLQDIMVKVGDFDEHYSKEKYAIYIDSEIYTEYWNEGYNGWEFQEAVQSELKKRGWYIEAWTKSVFNLFNIA